MKRIKRSLKGRYFRKVVIYFLTCCLLLNTSLTVAVAEVVLQPEGVKRGDITVSPDPLIPDKTNMTASNGAIGHFSDFDIAAGHFVDCVQPSSDASALFKVFSGDGTQIFGQFNATGHIYLVDTAGILFGAGSQINVTRLVASGLDITETAFDTILGGGQMQFAGGNGDVTNQGGIIRANSVYLIGDKVVNLGPIIAPNGLVVMAAGDQVSLAQDGSNVSVVVSDIGYSLDIRNANIVSADNGKIVLAAGDTFSRAIRNVSIIAATGGEISMQAAIVENKGYVVADASTADGDGGSISLIGTEEVRISPDNLGNPSHIYANARVNGNGGTINITAGTETVEGKVTIEENTLIKATGGSASGDGGSVIITCDDFEIAGDIDASFGNKLSGNEFGDPGELVINSPSVIIADSDGPREPDTLYEDYIEALSQKGTSLIVNAEEGITVKDIKDVIGTGEIAGQYGSIELHATGENSAVTFDDTTDTIRTTLGDIIIEAGAGGITTGNLVTAKDSSPHSKPYPGKIKLTTYNTGDIETGDLIIESGSGTAEIDVKASGNLTVNGDVLVGSETAISNVADQSAAEAMIKLKADNDVTLDGNVEAHASGIEQDSSMTKAYIDITAGNNATINGDLLAEASSSSSGTADAVIKVEAVGDIVFPGSANAIANEATAESTGPNHQDDEETLGNGHAQIIIDDSAIFLIDDNFSTNKSGVDVVLDVLANDTLEEEVTIDSFNIDPAKGSLRTELVGDKTVLIYNPPENLSALTFDENGKATVTFTYTVSGNTATVTITLTNGLPVAVDDLATTFLNKSVTINVLKNDTDPDQSDVLKAIKGAFSTKNGTLVLNENGTFTYTPNKGFIGDDSFTYAATDSFNTTSEVEVKITVSEEPPKPPKPQELPTTPALPYIPPAPIPEILKFEISGSPALAKWVALELGVDERMIDIWAVNTLASNKSVQPYNTYASFKAAATILKDADGSHIAALAKVISEFVSGNTPPTEEQMASIADVIARNTDEDNYYAVAGEYLDALVTYVSILNNDMGFSAAESVQFVTDKYVGRLAKSDNVGVATFIAVSLASLGG
ncbi:MAG: hypothetical protein A2168_09115 [Planctomycetes bacterium RBG_13_50_24]|nr:MAG: hypothetical protein A2168_09115 [Planctomycetes bacterium RBG_13_50_24]